MKILPFALAALFVSATAVADRGPPDQGRNGHGGQSLISITVNGLACAGSGGAGSFEARSWSWGASNTASATSGSGSGTGKAIVNALSIKKAFDACSPSLFSAVTSGRHFPSLTLTDMDENGVVVATVALSDVFVTAWNVGSSIHDETPDESVSFVFRRVCLTAGGSAQMCYDTATGTTT